MRVTLFSLLMTLVYDLPINHGGLAQLARAPALHAGGHRFESDILHQNEVLFIIIIRCGFRPAGSYPKHLHVPFTHLHFYKCANWIELFDILGKKL